MGNHVYNSYRTLVEQKILERQSLLPDPEAYGRLVEETQEAAFRMRQLLDPRTKRQDFIVDRFRRDVMGIQPQWRWDER